MVVVGNENYFGQSEYGRLEAVPVKVRPGDLIVDGVEHCTYEVVAVESGSLHCLDFEAERTTDVKVANLIHAIGLGIMKHIPRTNCSMPTQ